MIRSVSSVGQSTANRCQLLSPSTAGSAAISSRKLCGTFSNRASNVSKIVSRSVSIRPPQDQEGNSRRISVSRSAHRQAREADVRPGLPGGKNTRRENCSLSQSACLSTCLRLKPLLPYIPIMQHIRIKIRPIGPDQCSRFKGHAHFREVTPVAKGPEQFSSQHR